MASSQDLTNKENPILQIWCCVDVWGEMPLRGAQGIGTYKMPANVHGTPFGLDFTTKFCSESVDIRICRLWTGAWH